MMLLDIRKIKGIYLICGKIDLRRCIDGLAAVVMNQFQLDPYSKSLYLFCGTRKDRFKALYWDCDGYSGYNSLGNSITRVGCWAHVRRKFYEDANKISRHFKETKPLLILNKMFQCEKKWHKLSSKERLRDRIKKLKSLIDSFWRSIEYLQDILEKISQLPKFVKNEDLESYLPWNWQINKRQEII